MNRLLRLWAVALSCALLGCANDVTSPAIELVDGGRIVGRVRTGSTIDATIRAERIQDGENSSRFSVAVNRDGTFELDVPAGRYVVDLFTGPRFSYRAAGLGCGVAPDTLLVDDAHSPVTTNFDLASARVRIDVPQIYNDEFVSIVLHERPRSDARSCTFSRSSRVRNGAAEMTLPAIVPGAYRVEVELGSSGYERLWLPGVRDSADAAWFEVSIHETANIAGRSDVEPAGLQGKVVGAWLEMGLGVYPTVQLFALDSTRVHYGTSVDFDGSFELRLALPEPVKLLVEHLGIRQWFGGRSYADAQVFDLQPGEIVTGIEFVQSALLLDFQGETPFGSTVGRLFDAATLEPAATWSFFLVSSGLVPVPNLVPGTYLMRIESGFRGASTWAPQWFDRADTPMLATTIMLDQGEIEPIVVTLEKGGTIAGLVRDSAGESLYRVHITTADEPETWASRFVSSANPVFEFQGLPNGDWKVSAQRTGIELPEPQRVWYPSTTDWETAEAIPVRDHADVTGIEIVLPASNP